MEIKAIITASGRTDSDRISVEIEFDPPLPGESNDEPSPHRINPAIANLATTGFLAISDAVKADAEEGA